MEGEKMCRIILGILFVLMASDSTQAYYSQREYRDEYTENGEFIRVLAGLTQVPDDIPEEAIEVNLRFNMITNIPILAFSRLQGCQVLRLSYNEISVIDQRMFNGLDSLLHLYLHSNKITTVGEHSFRDLTSLKTLSIGANKFAIISDQMFSSLQACGNLYLANSGISAISEGAFASLSFLLRLSLEENDIQTVPGNTLPNRLKYLHLGRNKISTLGNVDFTNLFFLEHLELFHNMISTVPTNAFSTLSSCEILDLNNNPIDNIEVGPFYGLDKLVELRLFGTSLTHLSQNMFEGLPSLQNLQLNQGRISKITRGAFTGLDQLKLLYLNENELTIIESYMFSGLVSLESLYLDGNSINDIKDFAFLMLGNLTHLGLSSNGLGHLRLNTFVGLRSMEILYIGDNDFTTLDPLVLSPLPRPLELALDVRLKPSSMVCDIKLCWLKLEEKVGSIVWNFITVGTSESKHMRYPTCTGGVDWQLLQCPATVPCIDPGEVDFSERSQSFLPVNDNSQPGQDLTYSTNTEFRYTCDPCYTGGGTITCQSSGQWTRKPECVRLDNTDVACSAPALANGFLTPSSDQYECGVRVTYACDEGYTLSGPSDGACGPDAQFVGEIPSCTKIDDKKTETATESFSRSYGTEAVTDSPTNESPTTDSQTTDSPKTDSPKTDPPITDSLTTESPGQKTKTESDGTGGGSSGSIYGIVGGAVGGMVLTILVGLTIFCIKRSKKKNTSYADTAETQNTVTDGGYIGIVTEDSNGAQDNGLNIQPDGEASEAGYTQVVNETHDDGIYTQVEPTADRNTSQPAVTENETVYNDLAYENEYQEIRDALPKEDPYAVVDDDVYEN